MLRKTIELRKANPNLKILIAVGGWNQGSVRFSDMARHGANKGRFISSAVAMVKKFQLDGIDMDWECNSLLWPTNILQMHGHIGKLP